ncbi:hypothetical protein ASD13_13310 [Microbacterium sp. Root1433D1]|jgi:transcription elongation factor|uniref:hypothetical protein n=1 Tax=Microbacterium TaxID=33882 RepID=UPI0006FBCB0D|nr:MULTISPECIES: hypothetical protein [Microbacterium]KQY74439.1 hypothetical protein ASD13_13310 [Microbacterium sp. Root1433D1]WKT87805.1 hypothetical protein QYR02_10065 [Microbacterium liquefaciens]
MKNKAKLGIATIAIALCASMMSSPAVAQTGATAAAQTGASAAARAGSATVVWNSGSPTYTCAGRDQYVLLQWKRTGGTSTGYRFVDLWIHGTMLNNVRSGSGVVSVYTGLKYATYYELNALGGGTIEWATLGCYTAA